MLRTKLVPFAGRMQRIPKENEAFDIGAAGGGNLRSNSSAHRFAANHQRAIVSFSAELPRSRLGNTLRAYCSCPECVGRCSVYRKLNVTTLIPRAASSVANLVMKSLV